MNLNQKDVMLIELAKEAVQKFKRRGNVFHTSVGSVLIDTEGNISAGVNMESQMSSPVSVDAEYTAILNAYMKGMKKIDTLVTVHLTTWNKYEIFPPCGHCREFIRMFGDPWIILSYKKKARLSELLPY